MRRRRDDPLVGPFDDDAVAPLQVDLVDLVPVDAFRLGPAALDGDAGVSDANGQPVRSTHEGGGNHADDPDAEEIGTCFHGDIVHPGGVGGRAERGDAETADERLQVRASAGLGLEASLFEFARPWFSVSIVMIVRHFAGRLHRTGRS